MTNESKALQAYRSLQMEFTARESDFAKILPSHIPPARFIRVALTAVQKDPTLLEASQASLFRECAKCAADGLLPDGREAALVAFFDNEAKCKVVTYIPMVAGIRKKAWNSGEFQSWDVRLAYSNDVFEIILGDEERIVHRPALKDRGEVIAAYSIATFKDGSKDRDWMTLEEMELIRKKAKTQKVWGDPQARPEMYKKTMLKRHSKALPLSAELDRLMAREDSHYHSSPIDLTSRGGNGAESVFGLAPPPPGEREERDEGAPRRRPRRQRLTDLQQSSQVPADRAVPHADQEAGASGEKAPSSSPPNKDEGAGPTQAHIEKAFFAGRDAYWNGASNHPPVKGYEHTELSTAYQRGWKEAQEVEEQENEGSTL